jgi:hypothetical protein
MNCPTIVEQWIGIRIYIENLTLFCSAVEPHHKAMFDKVIARKLVRST